MHDSITATLFLLNNKLYTDISSIKCECQSEFCGHRRRNLGNLLFRKMPIYESQRKDSLKYKKNLRFWLKKAFETN